MTWATARGGRTDIGSVVVVRVRIRICVRVDFGVVGIVELIREAFKLLSPQTTVR